MTRYLRLKILDFRLIGLLCAFLLLCSLSCCGYSTRSLLPEYMKTVHIKLFENNTLKAGIDETVTNSVIDAFISGSGLRVIDEAGAALVVEGRVSGYSRDPFTYTSAAAVIEYKVTVTLSARCIDQVRNEVFWEGSVSDWVTYESDEDQAILDASKKAAEKLVNTILTNW
jgi:hypothetical protein